MAPLAFTTAYETMVRQRNERLRAIETGRYDATEAAMRASQAELLRRHNDVRQGHDVRRRSLLDDAQLAFVAYRDALNSAWKNKVTTSSAMCSLSPNSSIFALVEASPAGVVARPAHSAPLAPCTVGEASTSRKSRRSSTWRVLVELGRLFVFIAVACVGGTRDAKQLAASAFQQGFGTGTGGKQQQFHDTAATTIIRDHEDVVGVRARLITRNGSIMRSGTRLPSATKAIVYRLGIGRWIAVAYHTAFTVFGGQQICLSDCGPPAPRSLAGWRVIICTALSGATFTERVDNCFSATRKDS